MKQPENPNDLFATRFREANEHPKIVEANAVNLATVSDGGRPENRMVLLKSFNQQGYVFYTNFGSRKAQHLLNNPFASMCFYWEPLGQQIRISGKVEAVSDEEADQYFDSRPLQSRIGAWASKQSQTLDSQKTLLQRITQYTTRSRIEPLRRPEFWSGFRLIPDGFEFWTRGEFRIHRREQYLLNESGIWHSQLLYP